VPTGADLTAHASEQPINAIHSDGGSPFDRRAPVGARIIRYEVNGGTAIKLWALGETLTGETR
jgi:hypothetical protein